MLFYKPASAVVGPEVKINIPECARGMNNDYEVELCAVIGRDCKDVKIENALDNVLGYCVANDVSPNREDRVSRSEPGGLISNFYLLH